MVTWCWSADTSFDNCAHFGSIALIMDRFTINHRFRCTHQWSIPPPVARLTMIKKRVAWFCISMHACGSVPFNRELKQTTTTTATRTSPNKRFNEHNNSCAVAFEILVHFFPSFGKQQRGMTKFCVVYWTWTTMVNSWYLHFQTERF